jgi:hypothetical protein
MLPLHPYPAFKSVDIREGANFAEKCARDLWASGKYPKKN